LLKRSGTPELNLIHFYGANILQAIESANRSRFWMQCDACVIESLSVICRRTPKVSDCESSLTPRRL